MTIQEWLGADNQLGIDIWHKKYQYNNETFDEWIDRVSNGNESIKKLILEKKFLFGGRILASRGIQNANPDTKVTFSNCFLAGTQVLTKDGYKDIETVQKGEYVISDDGNFHLVNEVMSREYSGDIYALSSPNFKKTIYCTPNHRFLTNNGWKRADRIMACSKQVVNEDKIKISVVNENVFCKNGEGEVIDITDGFQLDSTTRIIESDGRVILERYVRHGSSKIWTRPRSQPIRKKFVFDSDFAYFVGRWLGDGTLVKVAGKRTPSILQIVFSGGTEKEQLDKCRLIGENAFGISASCFELNDNMVALRFESELLASWFYQNFGGKYQRKRVSEKYTGNLSMALGLCDSEGFCYATGCFRISLRNLEVLQWLRETLYLNGFNPGEIKTTNSDDEEFEFRIDPAQAVGHFNKYLSDTKYNKRMDKELAKDVGFATLTSIEIMENFSGTVYNLSVEDTHNYTVEGVVAHNCYVLDPPSDNLESIFDCAKNLARTYSYGGGVGIDLSRLAPKGSKVRNAAKESSGAVSFMDLYSMVTGLIAQAGRRGALMISMDCTHPDIEEFIDIKNDLDRVTKANISVKVTDEFMNAAVNNQPFTLSFVRNETGEEITKVVNARDIMMKLAYNNWDMGEPGVLFWDRIKDWNLLSEYTNFEYAGVNPCAEEPLPAGGSCLLSSLNLSEFVLENGDFDFNSLGDAVIVATIALNEVLDEGLPLHPLQIQRDNVRDWRQIGLGVFGIADMLIKMGIKYGSKESTDLCSKIADYILNHSLIASAILAGEYNETFPMFDLEKTKQSAFYKENVNSFVDELVSKHGLRNSQLLTIAPTGTLSTMLGVSGGIEPIFANSYTRKTESLHGEDYYYKVYTPIVERYMTKHNITEEEKLPDFFVTSKDLKHTERIDMQSVWQKYVDASISSTVNLPYDATPGDVFNIYVDAWKAGLKGITVFRDGCRRASILSTEKPKEASDSNNELGRGVVVNARDNLIGKKRKLTTGCGSLHAAAFFDPKTGDLMETYLSKGSTGGCNNYMIGLSRMISLAARTGCSIHDIIDQLNSTGVCPSYAVRKATKHDTSKGSCCPMAVGNALLEMWEEMQEELKCSKNENEETSTISALPSHESESTAVCPECNQPLIHEGGCNICKACGWSKCG